MKPKEKRANLYDNYEWKSYATIHGKRIFTCSQYFADESNAALIKKLKAVIIIAVNFMIKSEIGNIVNSM